MSQAPCEICMVLPPKKQALAMHYHIQSVQQSPKTCSMHSPILQIKDVRFEDESAVKWNEN